MVNKNLIKKILLVVVSCFLLCCCTQKREVTVMPRLETSTGEFNTVTLILQDSLWTGSVGDSIRKYLARPIDGIVPAESQLTLEQFSPRIFVDENKRARNLIIFDNQGDSGFRLERSTYATPQNVFSVKAPSTEQMVTEFVTHTDSILTTIHDFEINEKQHDMHRAPQLDIYLLEDVFGIKMMVPDSYSYVFQADNFIWIKKDIPTGNSNLLFYEIALDRIDRDGAIIQNMVQVKDSIAALYVHGTESDSFMKSDEGFAPFNKMLYLDHLQSYELKGTWEMKKSFMGGSYICYAIRDEYFDRYLFIEGFTYTPSFSKRDLLFELEAIIKTVRFHE